AQGLLDESERARLGSAALDELGKLSRLWLLPGSAAAREPFTREQVNELGWMDRETQRARAERAVREEIVPALAGWGVILETGALARLLRPLPAATGERP
ncbi:MAG TPA: hypothetical protein VIF15_18335, partial [Polyangiaceae bacterium]